MSYDNDITIASDRHKRNTEQKNFKFQDYFAVNSILNNLKYKDFIKSRNYSDAMSLIRDLQAITEENKVLSDDQYEYEDQYGDQEALDQMMHKTKEKKSKISQLPGRIAAFPGLSKSIKNNYGLIKQLFASGAYSKDSINEAVELMPELQKLKKIYKSSSMQKGTSDSNNPPAILFYNSHGFGKDLLKSALFCKKNVIPYCDDYFKGINSFDRISKNYSEDIAKPPVFETFINTQKRNPRFSIFDFKQHAYLGLRYTTLEKGTNDEFRYARRRMFIGFGGGKPAGGFSYESRVDTRCNESTLASQTSIPIIKVPQLFSNIVNYFNTYKYRLLSRNCNVFVKNMAKSIGLDSIANLHSSISPSISANKILSTMVKDAKKGKFGEIYSGFDSWEGTHERRTPISSMYNKGFASDAVTMHDYDIAARSWKYDLWPKLALNRNTFLNEILAEMCRDLGTLKQNQEIFSKNALELKENRAIVNPAGSENMKPEELQKNINIRPNERYHYYKLKAMEDSIINSVKTRYNKKKILDVMNKIDNIAEQLDMIDILLRYKSEGYYNRVFKGTLQHPCDIDKLRATVELAMKTCENRYINVFIYLSKVRDMLEKAKYEYDYKEKYELVRKREEDKARSSLTKKYIS